MFRNLMLRVGISGLMLILPLVGSGKVWAEAKPQLVISQFKVTSSSGQFVTLYNQSDNDVSLDNFELDYTSSSNKTSSEPMSGTLPSHTYYILADDAVQMCYRSIVNATSLGFTTTSGSIRLWQVASTDTSRLMTLQDTVSWTNKNGSLTTSPLQLSTIAGISYLRQPDSSDGTQVTAAGAGSWNDVIASGSDSCVLNKVVDNTPAMPLGGSGLGVGVEPPSTIISLASDDSGTSTPHLPAGDVGLAAPQITEILPNPAGTGTDDTDEFIELYNSNTVRI